MEKKELYHKLRPSRYDELVGQSAVVAQLRSWERKDQIPHALLLSGPTGTGKTTTARILRDVLGCCGSDYEEINAAESRGIDKIREVSNKRGALPMFSASRVWVFDEAHRTTADGQSAMLKLLEDGPGYCYYFLCTTDPNKLLPTIHGRCTQLKFHALTESELSTLIRGACQREGLAVSPETLQGLAEAAEGSARKALVLLEQVVQMPEEARAAFLERESGRSRGDQIARILLSGHRNAWERLLAVLKDCDEDAEAVRRVVLAFATNAMYRNPRNHEALYRVLKAFRPDTFSSNKAGLMAACYEVIFWDVLRG